MSDVTMDDIYEAQKKLGELRWAYWRSEVVFGFPWLLEVVTTTAVILIWYKLSRKEQRPALLLYALITILIASFMDIFGAELMRWDYPSMILPWGARLLSADVMLGLLLSLLYQYFTTWKSFWAASIVAAACFAFIMEPFTIWANIYTPYAWKHIYSFPLYIALAAGVKAIVDVASRKPNARHNGSAS